jgi:hypothetical protein
LISAASQRNERDDALAWSPADAGAVGLIRVPAVDGYVLAEAASCVEWFAEPDDSYQQEVRPAHVRAGASAEAGVALRWRGFVGDAGECVSLEHVGESADYQTLYQEFGFTAEHAVMAPKASLTRVRAR